MTGICCGQRALQFTSWWQGLNTGTSPPVKEEEALGFVLSPYSSASEHTGLAVCLEAGWEPRAPREALPSVGGPPRVLVWWM